MPHPSLIWIVARVVALLSTIGGAQAFDETKYPNLKGQWNKNSSSAGFPVLRRSIRRRAMGLRNARRSLRNIKKFSRTASRTSERAAKATTPSIPGVLQPGCLG